MPQYHMTSTERAKRVGKDLKTRLESEGHDVSHSAALEASARMFGYADWNDLNARHDAAPPSWDDGFEDETVARDRFHLQCAGLRSALVEQPSVELLVSVVMDLKATSRTIPGPGRWSKLAGIAERNAELWRRSLDRTNGIYIVATPSRSGRGPVFFDTVRELMGGGRPAYLAHAPLFPSDISQRSVGYDDADCIVRHHDVLTLNQDAEQALQCAEEGRVVLVPMHAQSVEQVFDKLADGRWTKRLRHLLRGVLVEVPLTGRAGDTITASECVVLEDEAHVDRRLRTGPARTAPEWQGRTMDFSTLLGDAATMHAAGWVDLPELRRSFGTRIDEWIATLDARVLKEKETA